MKKIKWGLIGLGGIAHRFAHDIVLMNDVSLYAVASRNLKKAEAFREQYGFEKSYGSYDELISDPNVDVIYIGLPHPFHKEIAIKCMNAKKAVLCEKPVAVNLSGLKAMIKAAKENDVFFMEAMWTRLQPVNNKVHELIASGRMGRPRLVTASFSFGTFEQTPFDIEHRLMAPNLAGGSLLDVGVYPISFASAVMGSMPTEIKSLTTKVKTGVDGLMSCIFSYENGEMAMLQSGIMINTDHNAKIYMDDGMIELPEFWKCTRATVHFNDPEKADEIIEDNFSGYEGFAYEIQHVMDCMNKGLKESPIITWQSSLDVMQIMDTIREDNDIKYPFE